MVCKNRAAMFRHTTHTLSRQALVCALALAGLGASLGSQAAKDDRYKPLTIEADQRSGYDMLKERVELNGNVMLTQGSMMLRADRVLMRQTADGFYRADATGSAGKPVSFRQARDVAGEVMEGFADVLEYDGQNDVVRLIGNARVRTLRGSQLGNEVSGAVIVYDNRTEKLSVDPGTEAPHPNGRVRMVMIPKAASAPESGASESGNKGLPLKPSNTLTPTKTP